MMTSKDEERWMELDALNDTVTEATRAGELPFTDEEWATWPKWYVHALSQLRLYVTADEIVFLSSSLTGDESQGGEVFALTETHAILLTVTPASSTSKVERWDRSMLNQMSVNKVPPYALPPSPTNSYEGWPKGLAVTLRYEGRDPLSVPYDNASPYCSAQLAAQHESLKEDLPHRRRSS